MAEEGIEDVVIVGAGLSGIGAACRLRIHQPHLSLRIFEARPRLGGTWDLFRYPGIRSDSDMYTLGYPFRPWHLPKSLTDGASIKSYIETTAKQYGVHDRIAFESPVKEMAFNSDTALWVVKVERADGTIERVRARFVLSCCGYYNYEAGHAPRFEGEENFQGDVVMPQFWPEDYDYQGKKVVVIGSGATAVTLVPAMAEKAGHVTMLQRSPTYIASLPAKDPWFDTVSKVLPPDLTYKFFRIKRIMMGTAAYQLSRHFPQWMRSQVEKGIKAELGESVPIDPHFKPSYNPWDQRFCLVPDADLFVALREKRASIVTDHIDRFTPEGLKLQSGETLQADVVVKATGLKLLAFGAIDIFVDGQRPDLSKMFNYKGFMFSGLPNFAALIGYTNASWTLKTDLAARYFCKLVAMLEEKGADMMVPDYGTNPPRPEPLINLQSGYVQRDIAAFPKQGHTRPWRNHQSYIMDYLDMTFAKLDDGVMQFETKNAAVPLKDGARTVKA
ncbi:MAG: NAD(P)/FAD-dependent oxidoreductase [Pseudomonadota bacterium]